MSQKAGPHLMFLSPVLSAAPSLGACLSRATLTGAASR